VEDVDAAERGEGLLDHPVGGVGVGDVGLNGECLRADQLGRLVGGILVQIGGHDARAFVGEAQGGRVADAGAGTGHECDPALKPTGAARRDQPGQG